MYVGIKTHYQHLDRNSQMLVNQMIMQLILLQRPASK